MAESERDLECRLLLLGREELAIEQKLQRLREGARDAVRSGRLDDADEICTLYEELREALWPLQSEIMQLERELYGARRKRSK
ncbi:MAG: hypothetical protein K0U74_12120 [Alphaproteobacteria bacterium]|nr:hypothetical protein [Alphaproteobacteria bacterium]